MSERTIAQQLAATPEDHPDYHKLRAQSARERAEEASTFEPHSKETGWFVTGFLQRCLEVEFARVAELERQLADMTEDRDGWKDLADARKPKTCLQLKP